MGFHKDIAFEGLHKARLDSGVAASKPVTPEGIGDVYWAYDTEELSIANNDGSAWIVYNPAGTPPPSTLGDLTDVIITSAALGQFLTFDGTDWINETYVPPDVNVSDLADVLFGANLYKGSLFVCYNAATTPSTAIWEALPPGTNGQSLFVDSTEPLGLKWDTPATGDLTTSNADYIRVTVGAGAPVATPGSGYVFLYQTSGGTYFKKSDGSSFGPFGTSSVTTLDSLSDVIITTAVKGHVIAHNGTNWVNLSSGTRGHVLYSDPSTATGLRWGTLASGGVSDDDLRTLFWLGF